jgi:hypothetical protein
LTPAVISPFFSRYVLGVRTPPECSYAECESCGFHFFDSRLTDAEVGRLYSGYRGEEYFRERHRAEPWYSRKVNEGIGGDPQEILARNAALEDFLSTHMDIAQVGTVLDFGGDRGQFIPDALGKQKFVFELSDAVAVEGVTRIASEAELSDRSFDFLMLTGVLEHCSEPLEILQKLRGLATGPESHFLIGVPYERFDVGWLGRGAMYRSYLRLLRHTGPLLMLADFYSTAFRLYRNSLPPLGVLKCHEHLNFFDEQSMTALLARANMEIVSSKVTQVISYPTRTLSLYVLARGC